MTLKTTADAADAADPVDDNADGLLHRVYDLMAEVVPASARGQPDLPLLAAGIDSMGLILLTTRIETSFNIEFVPEHLTSAVLETPAAIARLLHDHYRVQGVRPEDRQ